MGAREKIAFLVGSESRVSLLRALSDKPYRPTALATECSCARETAQRTLGGFVERGWTEKSNGRYRLTPGGEVVLEQYRTFVDTVCGTDTLEAFLTNMGPLAADFPTEAFDKLTVTEATAADPHAPVGRYLSVLGTEPVRSFEGVTPVVSRVYNDAAAAVIGSETEMELVIDESVLETSEAQYEEALKRIDELDQFSLYVAPDDLEHGLHGLAVVDGHAYVGAYDEENNLAASVDGNCDELLSWARERYDVFKQSAKPFGGRIASS